MVAHSRQTFLRTRFTCAAMVCCLALGTTVSGLAQTSASEGSVEPLTPPKTQKTNRFDETLSHTSQRLNGTYLPKGAPLDIRKRTQKRRTNRQPKWTWQRGFGTAFLIAIALFLLIALYRSGLIGAFLNRKKDDIPKGRFRHQRTHGSAGTNGALTAQDILACSNPRDGLQMFVSHMLETAAKASNLPLNRSYTAREILRRLPRSFSHLDNLRSLVFQAEPILFGDDTITSASLDDLLTEHKALFSLRSNRSRNEKSSGLLTPSVALKGEAH